MNALSIIQQVLDKVQDEPSTDNSDNDKDEVVITDNGELVTLGLEKKVTK